MQSVFIELTKYIFAFLMAFYVLSAYRGAIIHKEEKRKGIYIQQYLLIFAIHFLGYYVLYIMKNDARYIGFYFVQLIYLIVFISFYYILYPKASRLLVNNMCMLMIIGFIILTRLNFGHAIKQFAIAAVSCVISLVIPVMIRRMGFFRNLTWIYAAIGIVELGIVCIAGSTSYGAKISFTIAGITVQPSEFIKILFVFFVAAMYHKSTEFRQVIITTLIAALHVLILVLSRDLGGALIFFVAYMAMLYVATRKPLYFAGGLLAGSVAAVIAYKLFNHVRVRVVAWKTPLKVIDKEGYQICQSLFAIGTGGFFGLGLYQGMPNKIPVVEQDFIFAAISEELGGMFALCLILVCVSCFLMFLNIAMQLKDSFYKLVALGLGTIYGFQVFLTIGGVTKFIPSTGVTLPLVSYGGSSMLSTLIIFGIIQGLYILREDEGVSHNEKGEYKSAKKKAKSGFETEVRDLS